MATHKDPSDPDLGVRDYLIFCSTSKRDHVDLCLTRSSFNDIEMSTTTLIRLTLVSAFQGIQQFPLQLRINLLTHRSLLVIILLNKPINTEEVFRNRRLLESIAFLEDVFLDVHGWR